jgi:Xaa-Pro aminopeptidase
MLKVGESRARQKRLLRKMQEHRLDAVVLGLPWHVYYATAHLPHFLHQSGFILFSEGRSWLATANQKATDVAADEVVAFEAQWMATLRQEQPEVVAQLIVDELKSRGARQIGVDSSAVTSAVAVGVECDVRLIDDVLWQLRRVKDIDELDLMTSAIRASEAMYQRAREIIEPGIPETRVFTELQKAGVESLGEPMTALLGNDFVCGRGGGPPRKGEVAKAGEIYLLDLGPSYRGYFADNCRAFCVGGKPTDTQLKAASVVAEALTIVEQMARPGARCRDLFSAVSEHLQGSLGRPLSHHLGHGVGLQPHEFPHLNPKWDDVLLEGEIFAAEPGVYGQDIQWGIRIENNYLVTKSGVQNLLNAPMTLC